MFENCCCFMRHRGFERERHSATLFAEHGTGIVWHHGASTSKAAHHQMVAATARAKVCADTLG
jgi:hypothetical protein